MYWANTSRRICPQMSEFSFMVCVCVCVHGLIESRKSEKQIYIPLKGQQFEAHSRSLNSNWHTATAAVKKFSTLRSDN